MSKNKNIYIAVSLIPLIFLVKILGRFPQFVEDHYSNGVYPVISSIERYVFGWLPFSFGDLVYAGAIIIIIRWLLRNRRRFFKDTKRWFIEVFSVITIIYLAFHIFWGMNYYRQPLHVTLNIQDEYTSEELLDLTNRLIDKVNGIQEELARNDSTEVVMPYSKNEMLKRAPEGYEVLKQQYPHLEYHPRSVKRSLFSIPLTYMGFSGYLNPLTNEAQVDGLIPAYKFPTTTCHEIAHQLGYAAENEANFVGGLAAIHNPDRHFQYSGYAFALRHCLNEIFRRDEQLFNDYMEKVNIGVLKNYQEVRDFWESYRNPTEPLFKATYGAYLQSNNQEGGIESYSYVVALLVNYYKEHSL
ncbi:MAG: DUF3810 domain-containing protein [Flavobacteriaceae bacterium]|nr:DUF3810 domain-containing protein [Bacteroidia bacterium]NNL61742.1 DUF3810 domain-containing protein [Flavobacteriaceae bacterium]